MTLDGLDHVALGVQDLKHSVQWYSDVLGLKRQHDEMWNGVPTFIGTGETGLALFPRESPNAGAGGILHLAFRANRENFIAAQAALRSRGIEFHFEDHEIAHSIYFRDPDGHRLEITTYQLE